MTALFFYILKVVVCSGILYGYYHVALRNKLFHAWNRFFLLALIPFSILMPLLEMNIIAPADNGTKIVSAMRIVAGADEYMMEINKSSGINWSYELVSLIVYAVVSLVLAVIFGIGLAKLIRMIRKYQPVALDNFLFLNTAEPGTPFSFFRYLVWNREISLETDNGKRILEHELVHINEKHSWDKIFIHIILVFFWINPFFWLIRQEIAMIHEFIADRKTVGNGDTEAFAKLILAASFPAHSNLLTNSFFQSSIKRRLAMIAKKSNPLVAYVSRLMMIPILLVMIFAFAVQSEKKTAESDSAPTALAEKYTVVLDAGHGGQDAGAINGDLQEKELSLALAKMVKELNTNANLNIILTRSSDESVALPDRVKIASEKEAKLFLSLHIASAPSPKEKGIFAYVSARDLSKHEQNVRFASLLLSNLSSVYAVDKKIRQRENTGIWVLDHNVCPAVILECGHISNPDDSKYIQSKANQEKIARQILRSIEDYFSSAVLIRPSEASIQPLIDTAPKAITKEKTPPAKVTFLYLNGTSETLTIKEYRERTGRKDITFLSDTIKVNGNALPRRQAEDPGSNTELVIEGYNKTSPGETVAVVSPAGKRSDNSTANASTESSPTELVVTGYKKTTPDSPKEVVVTGYKKTDPRTTEEVVVTGYRKKDDGIRYFVDGKEVNAAFANSIDPDNIASVNVNKGNSGNSINIITKQVDASSRKTTVLNLAKTPPPLYILEGEEISAEEMKLIDPNKIESITVLKDKSAETIYGEKGKNGVVMIVLKKK